MEERISSFPITLRRLLIRVFCFTCITVLTAELCVLFRISLSNESALIFICAIPVLSTFLIEISQEKTPASQPQTTSYPRSPGMSVQLPYDVQKSNQDELLLSVQNVLVAALKNLSARQGEYHKASDVLSEKMSRVKDDVVWEALRKINDREFSVLLELNQSIEEIQSLIARTISQEASRDVTRLTSALPLGVLFGSTRLMPEKMRVQYYFSYVAKFHGVTISERDVHVLTELVLGGDVEKIGSRHGMSIEGVDKLRKRYEGIVSDVYEVLRHESQLKASRTPTKQRHE